MSAAATSSMRSTAKASSTDCSQAKACSDGNRRQIYRRDGADAHGPVARAEPRAGNQVDPRGGEARRRLRADARSQQHDAVESQGAVRASGRPGRRQVAEGVSRAGEGIENPSPRRLAGAEILAGEGGQPLLPDL